MVALNFQKKFADDVENGIKLQTIRAPWKNGKMPFEAGKKLQLYCGMRTKQCRKLGDAICTEVQGVRIRPRSIRLCDLDGSMFSELVFYPEMLNSIAQADGFKDWEALAQWFYETHDLPFEGYLVKWKLVTEPAAPALV